mmetsp:Transcript_22060/g.52744  ORF Transcript_22060/g.52744 Transcript_22060/m.52744 type:complete len:253 (-) Transcript_22060:1315-2073(-)
MVPSLSVSKSRISIRALWVTFSPSLNGRRDATSSAEMVPSPFVSTMSNARRTSSSHCRLFWIACQSRRLVTKLFMSKLAAPEAFIRERSCLTSSSVRMYPSATSSSRSSLAVTSPEWLQSILSNSSCRLVTMKVCEVVMSKLPESISLAIVDSTICFSWLLTANRWRRCTTVPSSAVDGAMPPSQGSFTQGCCRATLAVGRSTGSFSRSCSRKSTAMGETPSSARRSKSMSLFWMMRNSSLIVGGLKSIVGQ